MHQIIFFYCEEFARDENKRLRKTVFCVGSSKHSRQHVVLWLKAVALNYSRYPQYLFFEGRERGSGDRPFFYICAVVS